MAKRGLLPTVPEMAPSPQQPHDDNPEATGRAAEFGRGAGPTTDFRFSAWRGSTLEEHNMAKITFIEHNGTERVIDAENGQSLMQTAVDNLVPGIDGDCGGQCACATCHCYIEGPLADKLPEIGETERSMLELVDSVAASSRLACQITVSGDLEGLVVRTPLGQH